MITNKGWVSSPHCTQEALDKQAYERTLKFVEGNRECYEDGYPDEVAWRKVKHLLEEAPALLEAVETTLACLLDWMEIADEDDIRDYDYSAVEKARDVITKAKGEQP